MAANAPEIQILWDNGYQTSVKVTGYYTAATGGGGTPVNNLLVNPKALAFANTQQTCLVTLSGVEFAVGANGYIQLAWEGAAANTVVYTLGKTQAGTLNGTVTNNATNPTGNLVLTQAGLLPLDSYSLVLTLSKVQGFANASYAYSKDGGVA